MEYIGESGPISDSVDKEVQDLIVTATTLGMDSTGMKTVEYGQIDDCISTENCEGWEEALFNAYHTILNPSNDADLMIAGGSDDQGDITPICLITKREVLDCFGK